MSDARNPRIHLPVDGIWRISQRQIATKVEDPALKPPTSNLREAVERNSPWWPDEVITDGADHFILPVRASATPSSKGPEPLAASHGCRFVVWAWHRSQIVYCVQASTANVLALSSNPETARRFITAEAAQTFLDANVELRAKAQHHEAGVADIGLPYAGSALL